MYTFTAEDNGWVGEKAIDDYLKLLLANKESVFHLHTYLKDPISNGKKSINKKVNRLKKDDKVLTGIVCIYGKGCHWIACYGTLDYANKNACIVLSDSTNVDETELMISAKNYIQTILGTVGFNLFETQIDKSAPHQTDGFNCGIYSLMYIRNKLDFVPPVHNFNGSNASLIQLRQHILNELSEKKIVPFEEKRPTTSHTSTHLFRVNH